MIKRIITCCVCILILLVCSIEAKALTDKLETSALSEEEKEEFYDFVNLQVITSDTRNKPIRSFDVAENGSYALAFEGKPNHIYVYDANGVFLYGYAFYSSGTYGISFVNENIAIYFDREDKLAIYSPNGAAVDVRSVDHEVRNYTYVRTVIYRNYKKLGTKEYRLERDINIGPTYSRFVAINEQGDERVFYDISIDHNIGQVIWITSMIGFFAFVIYGVIAKKLAEERSEGEPEDDSLSCE